MEPDVTKSRMDTRRGRTGYRRTRLTLSAVARSMATNAPDRKSGAWGPTAQNGKTTRAALCLSRSWRLAMGTGWRRHPTFFSRATKTSHGPTDLGVYGGYAAGLLRSVAGAWAHWARVWEEDLNECKSRFSRRRIQRHLDEEPDRHHVSRWIDGVTGRQRKHDQRTTPVRWFCGARRPNRRPVKENWCTRWKTDLMVVGDIRTPTFRVCRTAKTGCILLPATTQFRTSAVLSRRSNRSSAMASDQVVETPV